MAGLEAVNGVPCFEPVRRFRLIKGGGRRIAVTALPTDMTDRAQIAAAKIDVAQLGPVAMLMCNAGREGGGGILSDGNVWRRSGIGLAAARRFGRAVRHYSPSGLVRRQRTRN